MFQTSNPGYNYYTSYSLLKLLFKIHPIVGEGPQWVQLQGEQLYIDTEKQLLRMGTESGTSVRVSYINFQAHQKVAERIQKMK